MKTENIESCTITLMVASIEKSVDFYVETLGLALRRKYGAHYAEVEGPGILIGLHPVEERITIGNNMSVGFGVRKFDDFVQYLTEQNLSLVVKQDGPIRLAHFADLDSNSLFVVELS